MLQTNATPSGYNVQKSAKVLSKAPNKIILPSVPDFNTSGEMKRKVEETRAPLLSLQESKTDCTWVMCSREKCSK